MEQGERKPMRTLFVSLSDTQLQVLAWGLSLTVSILAVFAWGQQLRWNVASINNHQLFPLFGLLAFSLMWAHYLASVARHVAGHGKDVLKNYFEITSYAVLFFIFAHPGLLAYQLARGGLGLPPGSYLTFVGPGLYWAIAVAAVALLMFIAFEFRRIFDHHPWWRYVLYAVDLAVVGIYFHALALGTHVQDGWYRGVWFFYGVTLALALAYVYYQRFAAGRDRTRL